MSLIRVLDEPTINQIAAGEVVERPSAVVKELIENAMDAGATAITAEIKEGGLSFIRITDNGGGIPREDIPLAFLRHATSKIRTAEDLLSVTSLGFRGEALSSIAAVAQLELITKTPSSLNGYRYIIEGGDEKSIEEIGCPGGTTIIVRNLFYNTPARRKFLKSPTSEGGYISDLMERLMVSHPDISFKFIMNNQVKLQSSGNQNSKDILYNVYGRDIARELLPIEYQSENFNISGFIGKPIITRGNRNFENYFINGRYIKSSIITRAIEDAFKPFLMQHKYPFTSLYFQIAPSLIDVNVHPQKLEIRLKNGEEIYQNTYQVIRDALSGKELIPNIYITPQSEKRKEVVNIPEPFEEGRRKQLETMQKASSSPFTTHYDKSLGPQFVSKVAEGNKDNYTPKKMVELPDQEIQSSKANNSEIRSTEIRSADTNRSGINSTDIDRSDIDRSGINSADTNSSNINRSDINSSDTNSSNINRSGINSADTNSSDIDRSGINSADINSSNINRSGINRSDINSSDMRSDNISSESKSADINTWTNLESNLNNNIKEETIEASSPQEEPIFVTEQMNLFADSNSTSETPFLSKKALADHKIIGQLFSTYWLVEYQKDLYIIDQHAAHEKVLYEKIMASARTKTFASQQLLPPMVITLTLREQEIIHKHEEVLTSLGYEIEHFGGNEFSVRAVPADLYGILEKDLLLEFIDDLTGDTSGNLSGAGSILERVASLSCKAAVKANHTFSQEEAYTLIKELLTLDNPYHCPHGRPVIISMSRYELEKKFKRII